MGNVLDAVMLSLGLVLEFFGTVMLLRCSCVTYVIYWVGGVLLDWENFTGLGLEVEIYLGGGVK